MARQQKKPAKTFQQRQSERKQREDQETTELVEEMASRYSCSVGIGHDFVEQCTLRLDDLEFDLACNQLALDFWSSPPEPAQPTIQLLYEIAAVRRRHANALTSIRERLNQLSGERRVGYDESCQPVSLSSPGQPLSAVAPDAAQPTGAPVSCRCRVVLGGVVSPHEAMQGVRARTGIGHPEWRR